LLIFAFLKSAGYPALLTWKSVGYPALLSWSSFGRFCQKCVIFLRVQDISLF
jgi:hypothetical protein